VERASGWIAQVYGYAVCLICVIIILVSTHTIIDSAFDYANPTRSGMVMRYGPEYDMGRAPMRRAGAVAVTVPTNDSGVPDTAERRTFRENRQMELDTARYTALRSLVSSIVFLLIATGMFLLPWRWIRRTTSEAAVT
jgi:hypothetical protein